MLTPTGESAMKISFLIPAYNEAHNLPATIESIKRHCPNAEIIVGDHQSIDLTRETAMEHGAKVVTVEGGTVGHVRNVLATEATGDVLVFHDADVRLTPQWERRFPSVLERMPAVVGASLSPPEGASWIVDSWFRQQGAKSYVATGHMVIARSIFEQLGGFDLRLSSGEDVDLCNRAKAITEVIPDPELQAVHMDFPQTIKAFCKREVWHGSGDFASVKHFLGSKVAMMAVGFVGLVAASPAYPPLLLAAAAIPVGCSVLKAPKMSLKHRAPNAVLWSAYLSSRAVSAFFAKSEKRLYASKL